MLRVAVAWPHQRRFAPHHASLVSQKRHQPAVTTHVPQTNRSVTPPGAPTRPVTLRGAPPQPTLRTAAAAASSLSAASLSCAISFCASCSVSLNSPPPFAEARGGESGARLARLPVCDIPPHREPGMLRSPRRKASSSSSVGSFCIYGHRLSFDRRVYVCVRGSGRGCSCGERWQHQLSRRGPPAGASAGRDSALSVTVRVEQCAREHPVWVRSPGQRRISSGAKRSQRCW